MYCEVNVGGTRREIEQKLKTVFSKKHQYINKNVMIRVNMKHFRNFIYVVTQLGEKCIPVSSPFLQAEA